MAKKLFLLEAPASAHRGNVQEAPLAGGSASWGPRKAGESAGASLATGSAVTVDGPTSGLELSADAAPVAKLEWISDPLSADFTIDGTITFNVWMAESNMAANAGAQVVIEKIDGATGGLTTIANSEKGTELPVTTRAAQNWTLDPSAVACKRGDRLRIRVAANDGGGTMNVGHPFTIGYNGGTGGSDGDSWVQFTEDLTFESLAASGSTYYLREVEGYALPTEARQVDDSALGNSWSNIANVLADDATYATITPVVSQVSDSLILTGFGFNLPAAAVIRGVQVEYQMKLDFSSPGVAARVTLMDGSTTIGTTGVSGSHTNTTEAAQTLGSATDTWGATLDGGVINRLGIQFKIGGANGNLWYLDCVRVRVYYSLVSSSDRPTATTRGPASKTVVTNTAAGPTSGVQLTLTAGGSAVDWYTPRLNAFTLGGVAKFNLRALESNTAANASLKAELAVCDSDGSNATVWGVSDIEAETGAGGSIGELATSDGEKVAWVSGDDVAVTAGQRLRFRVYLDDCPNGALASGHTVTVSYDGPSASAAGDSYVILPQTVTEYVIGPMAPIVVPPAAVQRAANW